MRRRKKVFNLSFFQKMFLKFMYHDFLLFTRSFVATLSQLRSWKLCLFSSIDELGFFI